MTGPQSTEFAGLAEVLVRHPGVGPRLGARPRGRRSWGTSVVSRNRCGFSTQNLPHLSFQTCYSGHHPQKKGPTLKIKGFHRNYPASCASWHALLRLMLSGLHCSPLSDHLPVRSGLRLAIPSGRPTVPLKLTCSRLLGQTSMYSSPLQPPSPNWSSSTTSMSLRLTSPTRNYCLKPVPYLRSREILGNAWSRARGAGRRHCIAAS